MIYLDNAATTLSKPPAVPRSMARAATRLATPGRGAHPPAMEAAEAAYACRAAAARLFNVRDPERVVFTFNATHALNIAIKSLVKAGGRVVVSGYEHNAVIRPLHALGARVAVASSELFEPEVAVSAFERRLADGAELVVCNHVSNVFGFVLPVERIAGLCRERGIPLVVDASQSAGVIDINFEELGADFVCMPGHKGLYGPQGTGLLLCNRVPEGIIQGGTGSQSLKAEMPDVLPDRLEAGTHNMPGIAGLFEGISFVEKTTPGRILAHERGLVGYAAEKLLRLDGVRVFSSEFDYCQTGVLSFIVDGMTCEEVGDELARRGVCVRTGLHCAPLAHKTAGTVRTGTVRVSVSWFNTRREVAAFAGALEEILRRRGKTRTDSQEG